jgi:hypothetical protein
MRLAHLTLVDAPRASIHDAARGSANTRRHGDSASWRAAGAAPDDAIAAVESFKLGIFSAGRTPVANWGQY